MKTQAPKTDEAKRKATLLRMAGRMTRDAIEATATRDAALRAAHAGGASFREIEDATGIPHMTVKRIVDRQTAVAD